jgi:DNA-binding XRE family transcriptional regulator
MIDLFAQEPRAPKLGRKPVVMREREVAGPPVDHDLTEEETAAVLGVTRQTLRNMRVGYKNAYGYYPPKLVKDVHWHKFRESKRSPVLFKLEWINKMLGIQRLISKQLNN